ncbi:GNAT family N-acetyltransferase [Pengzhenrongella sp.]|uniref:GNAT family N-acetyltransferase n=1 Tax=Pengzhenrongella sp. TaxID=2888820 RepID=UPI002F93822C
MGVTTGSSSSLRLRPLGAADEPQAREAHTELALDGFEFLLDRTVGESWPAYLARLEDQRVGVDLPEGWVPSTFLVAEVDGVIVGRISIRHLLNAYLAEVGGHIGYGVRPGFRRRGYATEMLRQSLVIARGEGVERVLVTCDADNVGSAQTIENCGGELERIAPGRDGWSAKRRYWIDALAVAPV